MFKYLTIPLLFFLSACSEKDSPLSYTQQEINEFKDIAWADLTEQELSNVIITEEQAQVYFSKIGHEDGLYFYQIDTIRYTFIITHPEVDYRTNQTIVIIVINTNVDALLGPIRVIIEPRSKQAFGRGTRF